MSIVSAYWPIGTAIGVSYFTIDSFVGWNNVDNVTRAGTARVGQGNSGIAGF